VLVAVAAAGCSSAGGETHGKGCGVAFVYQDPIGLEQDSQDIQDGLLRGAKETGVKLRTVEASGLASFGDNMRAMASKHCYSAIGTAYPSTDETVAKIAKQFPKQHFFTIHGGATGANVTNYTDEPEQLTFVAGAMAAKATTSKKVGVVLGMDIPLVRRWKNGFVQGARFSDPSVRVLTNYVGSFTDAAKSATIAVGQSAQDADLVLAASGANLEISRQGAAHHYRSIITNSSEVKQVTGRHDAVAFAAVEDIGNVSYGAMRDLHNAAPARGTRAFGFAESVFTVSGVTGGDLPGIEKPPAAVVAAGQRAYKALLSKQVTIKDPMG
jgi:basic membrane protein A and related proteins